ncbi:DUF4192 domain-containing protein, partial [Streptomyces sp. MCAF7]
LLHQACNEGLDPELLRRSLRQERVDRALQTAVRGELERLGAAAATASDGVSGGSSGSGRTGRPRGVRAKSPGAQAARTRPAGRMRVRRRPGQRGDRSRH